MSAEEWIHFKRHAKRVRKLSWTAIVPEKVTRSWLTFLEIMKDHYGDRPAFPHVHTLSVDTYAMEVPGYFTLVAPSGLQKLTIQKSTYFGLTDLIYGASVLQKIHSSIQSIQTLNLDTSLYLEERALKIISKMPHLQRLTLAANIKPEEIDGLYNPSYLTFPALRELQLTLGPSSTSGDPSDTCITTRLFLRLISSGSLEKLNICHTGLVPVLDTLGKMIDAIVQFSPTLQDCSLKIAHPEPHDHSPTTIIPFSVFLPLVFAAHTSLSHLDFSTMPLDVRKMDLDVFQRGFPNLNLLYLGGMHPASRTDLCVADVAAIVARCPRLAALSMPLPCIGAALGESDDIQPTMSTLKELTFGTHGEEDDGESELSKVLDEAERLFPCADIGTAED